MAKLSANGNEITRFVRKRERNDPDVLRDTTYLSVRSNGYVLKKHIAIIVDVYNEKGFRAVTAGWKRFFRLPMRAKPEDYYPGWIAQGFAKVESGK